MSRGERAAERAARLIGTRFRPQGRDPALGLDCLGLIVTAHALPEGEVPGDYRLRGNHLDALLAGAARRFRRVAPAAARTGDVLVMEAGVNQLHLAIRTAAGFVHADARLGRVVETPGAPPWAVLAALRRRARAKQA